MFLLHPLLLLLPSLVASLQCPCDTTPQLCDADCCCDPSCTSDHLLSFTCQPFLLSSSQLCCQDSLVQSSEGGGYGVERSCSSSLTCLNQARSVLTQFSNDTTTTASPLVGWAGEGVDLTPSASQYTNTAVLVAVDSPSNDTLPFRFPRPFLGDQCGMGPSLFYREIHATCRRTHLNLATDCTPGTLLDYGTYLGELLTTPAGSSTLDLAGSAVFLCEDPATGAVSSCTASEPSLSSGVCSNAVRSVSIVLTVSNSTMALVSAAVTVTLTQTSSTELVQTFRLSYHPTEDPLRRSGNFGYPVRSPLLSGVLVNGTGVVMSSEPAERPLALFTSPDCTVFGRQQVQFGVGQYEGCRLGLPFYRYVVVRSETTAWCEELRNVTNALTSLPTGTVVGVSGNASVSDPSQWLHVLFEPTKPSLGLPSEQDVTCYDVTTDVTYKVFYTRIGNLENPQAVITNVKVEYGKQNVVLLCTDGICTRQQYLVLSNSVQFIYHSPSKTDRFKVHPTTTVLLPQNFFYPITSGASCHHGLVAHGLMIFLVYLLT